MQILLLSLLLFVTAASGSVVEEKPKVLLVSFDGFRWDYLNKYNVSWFDYLRQRGSSTNDGSIIGTFASSTFPSHTTISTGLFQESHGIIANTMYDSEIGSYFTVKNRTALRDPKWWKDATPIWISVEESGMKAGTYFWPGSESTYDGKLQSIMMPYNKSTPFEKRVDTVVEWLLYKNISFATLYFSEPDAAGHEAGPISKKVRDAVARVNKVLGRLITSLQRNNLFDKINLIVTSDHGMAAVKIPDTIIPLYSHIENRTDLIARKINVYGAYVDFLAKPGKIEELYSFLKELTRQFPNMTVYRKRDIPDRFHYKRNKRVPDVFVLANEGYYLLSERSNSKASGVIGAHGYDNTYPSMRPIFIAHGPNFRKQQRIAPFRQVDIYPLLTRLMGIRGRPNNGSYENVRGILQGISSAPSILPGTWCLGVALILNLLPSEITF